ncbi:hypothetical protein EJB05_23648 [Eragrostis curvula]|uniref:Uncharacterized protein n=1 Tax=Eragrostis curvula TaxID=38414 RepID=A0A5J9V7M2_9POAL|nr:hypothetical protein EJB05_23648 [Eragrostis curvula]
MRRRPVGEENRELGSGCHPPLPRACRRLDLAAAVFCFESRLGEELRRARIEGGEVGLGLELRRRRPSVARDQNCRRERRCRDGNGFKRSQKKEGNRETRNMSVGGIAGG